MSLDISRRTFVRMRRSERDAIAAAIANSRDIDLIAQTYAESLAEFVPETGYFDDEVVLYTFLDMRKAGFWDKISLEEFLDKYGQGLTSNAKECLEFCRSRESQS